MPGWPPLLILLQSISGAVLLRVHEGGGGRGSYYSRFRISWVTQLEKFSTEVNSFDNIQKMMFKWNVIYRR